MLDIQRYIPSFYEELYGKTNVVSVSADILQRILRDAQSFQINRWDTKEALESEFKVSKTIRSNFKIREPELLKSFFCFKGTYSDLVYMLDQFGYDAVIKNDGGFTHIHNGVEEEINIGNATSTLTRENCELQVDVELDINDPNFSGYGGGSVDGIRSVASERIYLCAYISKVVVTLKASDTYDWKQVEEECIPQAIYAPLDDGIYEDATLEDMIYADDPADGFYYGEWRQDPLPIQYKVYTRSVFETYERFFDEIEILKNGVDIT